MNESFTDKNYRTKLFMHQEKAQRLALEGFDLLGKGELRESESRYLASIELVDPSHWSTQDIHGEFALVLKKLGKKSEALEQLQLALTSALLSGDRNSNGVTLATYFLADYQIELGEVQAALNSIENLITEDCKLKWLIYFIASKAHYSHGNMGLFEKYAEHVLITAPEGKFKDITDIANNFGL